MPICFYSHFLRIIGAGFGRLRRIVLITLGVTLLQPPLRLAQAVARAVGLNDVHPTRQAVQQGSCQPLTTEDVHPGLERQVRRYNQTQPLVGAADGVTSLGRISIYQYK